MVYSVADAFAAEVARLCATPVRPAEWGRFLELVVPRTDPDGEPLTGRSLTMADSKCAALEWLYRSDERVAPWAGTAHGVLAAVNTYKHHEGIVRGSTRAERNMLKTINGDFAAIDGNTWHTLSQVLN